MLSQIQPHFLYNSLTSVMDLCDKNPKQAKAAIADFADYLRGNLSTLKEQKLISFKEELEHIKKYLKLEKLRFKENLKIEYNITISEFLEMVESVGWNTYSKEQLDKALKNTMYMVKATVDGKLAGIGRVVGDYSIVCCLSDICVKPEFQNLGIGLKITKELKRLIEENINNGDKILIELTPTAGNEPFYQKAGFKYKPEKITGMYLWIKK